MNLLGSDVWIYILYWEGAVVRKKSSQIPSLLSLKYTKNKKNMTLSIFALSRDCSWLLHWLHCAYVSFRAKRWFHNLVNNYCQQQQMQCWIIESSRQQATELRALCRSLFDRSMSFWSKMFMRNARKHDKKVFPCLSAVVVVIFPLLYLVIDSQKGQQQYNSHLFVFH